MCGIFAYIGESEVANLLVTALKRMEYRGYDSAGVAVHNGKSIVPCKRVGKVSNLESAVKSNQTLCGKMGIAHTRWATHGAPSDANSHPHFSQGKTVAVVHNGIIENYASLKEELRSKGYQFASDTDTELLAHLVEDLRKELGPDPSWAVVVCSALSLIRGTYGVVFIFEDDPNLLIGARKGSPMIAGISEGQYVLASDPAAVVEHTKEVVYLRDGEIIEIRRSGYKLRSIESIATRMTSVDECVNNPLVTLELTLEQIEKGGYKHFMLKEIFDQPNSIRNTIRGRLYESKETESDGFVKKVEGIENELYISQTVSPKSANLKQYISSKDDTSPGIASATSTEASTEPNTQRTTVSRGSTATTQSPDEINYPPTLSISQSFSGKFDIKLGGLNTVIASTGLTALETMAKAKRIIITACGTSWHSGLIGEYLIEQFARIPVEVEYASEFRYRNPILYSDDVVIAISQSGETADTLEAIRIAKQSGAMSLGIVNVVGSTIARDTDAGIFLHAGPEIGVASTKAFTAQVMVLIMLALKLGEQKKTIDEQSLNRICMQIEILPHLIQQTLEQTDDQVKMIAKFFRLASNFLFLGRGIHFPVALEAALKLKEISYIHAEGYPAAEMKHGPIALIDHLMPVVVIAPKSDPNYEKIKSNIEQVKARSGELIIITEDGNDDFENFAAKEFIVRVPVVDPALQPLLAVVPLQLLAYYIADLRGCSIDQPRNLAKSVTVE